MQFTGKLENISRDWKSGKVQLTFSVNEPAAVSQIESIQKCEKLSIKAVKHKEKRSLDANAMLWACLGELAAFLHVDKWELYLQMLKRYGKYTYICVKPAVVEAVKAQWRESEVIGEIDINGQKAVQMLCYFGSSTYNSKEFSVLLEGVIEEMKDTGLDAPPSQDMRRALEDWGRTHGNGVAV